MRRPLISRVLDQALPITCPDEEYFSAGPNAARRSSDTVRQSALLIDLRRQAAAARRRRTLVA
jgi:hypothetical protein